MTPGYATGEGTRRYAARFLAAQAAGFYRDAQGLEVSSLGIGTYLGTMSDATDRSYSEAIQTALGGGINLIDTSLNYRNQRSERSIAAAIQTARREEFVVCTKAGYLVPDAVPFSALKEGDVVGRMHSMAPAFLRDQLERSRANLGLATIDVFYLHNPETQLEFVDREDFYRRTHAAFETLEQMASEGTIRYYGTATWDGYRRKGGESEGLSLARLVELAKNIAGENHRFRFIQLPFNLGMAEAFTHKAADGRSVLDLAEALGITVVASATLLQSRLASDLPEAVAARLPGLSTDAQRAIQFTRSTPGITTALVGMSRPEHVQENLGIAQIPPASDTEYRSMYQAV
jgi:aryl-alcohol dehydrogenase-like predicted oxidoreductase